MFSVASLFPMQRLVLVASNEQVQWSQQSNTSRPLLIGNKFLQRKLVDVIRKKYISSRETYYKCLLSATASDSFRSNAFQIPNWLHFWQLGDDNMGQGFACGLSFFFSTISPFNCVDEIGNSGLFEVLRHPNCPRNR